MMMELAVVWQHFWDLCEGNESLKLSSIILDTAKDPGSRLDHEELMELALECQARYEATSKTISAIKTSSRP